MLETRLDHLVDHRQRYPDLNSMQPLATRKYLVGHFLRVHNTFAGRHPVDLTGTNYLHVAETVTVQHLTFKQVRDRGEAYMRM